MPTDLKPGRLSPDRNRSGKGPGTESRMRVVVWSLVALTVVSSVWLMVGAPI
jgi:hypothetical protein